jgi:PAS domain S-box-containing protein
MDTISLDFEQAKAKHLLFKSNLRSILYGLQVDEAPVISHTECAVGKWIYDHALESYGQFEEMHQVEKVHADMHQTARSLVAKYHAGQVEEARSGLVEMEKIAENLVLLLTVLEEKIKAYPTRSSAYQDIDVSLKELNELTKANQELDQVIRSQSVQLLQDRQTLYEVLMQLPATVAVLRGPDHVFEMANTPFLAGFINKDIIGKTVREVLPSLEGQGFFELVESVYKTGEPFTGREMPVSVTLEDGVTTQGYLDLNYQALRDTTGTIDGVLSFTYDVTEAVMARKKAEESEQRLRFLSDAMPVQVWTATADGKLDYVNQQTALFFGRSAAEIIGDGWQAVVHPEDLPQVIERWVNSLQRLESYEVEFRLKNKTGQYRWHLARANAFTGADNKVCWYGTNTDIHDMKQLQEQIRQSYEDLEVKVKFRNLELERANGELKKELEALRAKA